MSNPGLAGTLKHMGSTKPVQIAPLAAADDRPVLALLQSAPCQHLHLDWLSADELLNHRALFGWVARSGSTASAFLAATGEVPGDPGNPFYPDAPRDLWLRAAAAAYGHEDLLDLLWESLVEQIEGASARAALIGLLAFDSWAEYLARRWKFSRLTSVITLRWDAWRLPALPPSTAEIVNAGPTDIANIALLDVAAFGPLWRYGTDTLGSAFRQAELATVAMRDGKMAGYQLSSQYEGGGHVARLAVWPEFQGQGIGRLLVVHALHHFRHKGIRAITVNTQANNIRSRRLYTSLGFRPTGHEVPVWTLHLPGHNL